MKKYKDIGIYDFSDYVNAQLGNNGNDGAGNTNGNSGTGLT